jgi:hypothetical protein
VLKYCICLHIYIQEETEFLDISSLGMTYRYAAKIEKKFRQKKRDVGSANQNQVKGDPNYRTKDNAKAWWLKTCCQSYKKRETS